MSNLSIVFGVIVVVIVLLAYSIRRANLKGSKTVIPNNDLASKEPLAKVLPLVTKKVVPVKTVTKKVVAKKVVKKVIKKA